MAQPKSDREFMAINHRNRVTKSDLPQKICETCGRPFAWRKKWQKVWAEVKYCSHKCRSGRRSKGAGGVPLAHN